MVTPCEIKFDNFFLLYYQGCEKPWYMVKGVIMESTEFIDVIQETEIIENIIYQCEHGDTIVDLLNTHQQYYASINNLLFRLSQVLEFFLALVVIVAFSVVCYSFLKNFTRF